MNKTILITGGAGYIGSHIGYLMAQQGHTVIVLDNFAHKQSFNHAWATVIQGDYGDKNLLNTLFTTHTIDTVIHSAGSIEKEASITDPLLFYDNNVTKTITLLSSMRAHNVHKIIFSSSADIYGTPLCTPINDNHPKNPTTPYARTKLMIETILHDAHNAYGLQFIALRYFNVAGAYPEQKLGETRTPTTNLIPLILNAAYAQKPFYMHSTQYFTPDGSYVREFIHVRDIADAYLKSLHHLHAGCPSDYFNIGTGEGHSIKQIIATTQEITNTKITVIEKPSNPKKTAHAPYLIIDPTRAHDILKWIPRYSDLTFIIRSAHVFNQQHL